MDRDARYLAMWGGRGSSKSHSMAAFTINRALAEPGTLSVCFREIQKTLADSAKRLIEAKMAEHRIGEADGFKIYEDKIKTRGDGIILFMGMQDHTAESIKSLEGFSWGWGEEAQTLSARSLSILRPTFFRVPGCQLGFTWNPRRKSDPVDVMFRGPEVPTGSRIVKANWRDNPWFPPELEIERLDCLRQTPDQYDHIWEGGYVTVAEGAYYARQLAEARLQGRIGRVGFDPLLPVRLFVDIGGTGARADAFSIWPGQFIGREIRTRDYYEAVGQDIGTHLAWLRQRGYGPDRAEVVLPHDGATQDRVYSVSYESAFRAAGYNVTVVPNQGKGAAAARIEAARQRFPIIWFDEASTEGGREALGWYHENRQEDRNVGLGPLHDWSSNGADSFGLMCVAYAPPKPERERRDRPREVNVNGY